MNNVENIVQNHESPLWYIKTIREVSIKLKKSYEIF
jgi:hypothetical protein